MADATEVAERVRNAIRNVPDFPKPGIQFKDISPVLLDDKLIKDVADVMADAAKDQGITKVIGIESRGFILGPMIAIRLGAGFVPARKAGKLPGDTHMISYALEYGEATIEVHTDAIGPDDRVLIHDDLLATGGTAEAARQLVAKSGGLVTGYSFLVELGFLKGRDVLGDAPIFSMVSY